MEQLKQFKTCELVKELELREGVKTQIVEPYDVYTASEIEGPAIILTVID